MPRFESATEPMAEILTITGQRQALLKDANEAFRLGFHP